MKILVAPDKFKHSLSAEEVAANISKGLRASGKHIEVTELPLSDGGEGFVKAIIKAKNGDKKELQVHDALNRKIGSYYGIIDGDTAIIEMALASGIELLKENERDPAKTTTYGTGELILDAIKKHCKKIIIGIGGSATNDGGMGMARALGFKFFDGSGNEIKDVLGLQKLNEIEFPENFEELIDRKIVVASDVENKLLGEKGASAVYGPQKGADEKQIKELDAALSRLAEVAEKYDDKKYADIPGSGAAGGLGFGILFFLKGKMEPGFNIIEKLTKLEEKIKSSDFIITGEGKLDKQSLSGKTPIRVAELAKKHDKSVIAICGTYDREAEEDFKNKGISKIYALIDRAENEKEAKKKTAILLQAIGKEIIKSDKVNSS